MIISQFAVYANNYEVACFSEVEYQGERAHAKTHLEAIGLLVSNHPELFGVDGVHFQPQVLISLFNDPTPSP